MRIPNPAGMLAMATYVGERVMAGGETTITVAIPGGTRSTYVTHSTPTWNTTCYSYAQGNGFVVRFGTPAPAGSKITWSVTTV